MTTTHYLTRKGEADSDSLTKAGDPAGACATRLALDWIAEGRYPEVTALDAHWLSPRTGRQWIHDIYFTGPEAALDALEDAVAEAMAGGRVEGTCARCRMDVYPEDLAGGLCAACLATIQTGIVNCTPHAITLFVGENPAEPRWSVTLPPSGHVARVTTSTKAVSPVYAIPVVLRTLDDVTGLPESKFGRYYLVSSMVADVARDRTDLLVPGELIRDADGHPIGCQGLAQVW